ncbi:MAG: sensor histidine kinase [Oscillospiraceae bacterium]|nr:sensor histidine kinase [Oscillospiraceae bacterium]
MNAVLILAIISTVAAVLVCTMFLFLRTYSQSLYRSARVSSQRTVSQAGGTVDQYLREIHNVMSVLRESLEDPDINRREFIEAFLRTRPEVVSVSTYAASGRLQNCYGPGHTIRPAIEENLSFRAALTEEYHDGYISAPHVVTLFEGYYPWAVTIISTLDAENGEEWAALDISCTNISSYINGTGIGQRGYCFLMDTSGNIVYHPQQQLIYSDLKNEDTSLITGLPDGSHVEGNVIYTVQTLKNGPWKVVGVSFMDELISNGVNEVVRILLPAAALILIAMLVISAILSHQLSRPLHALAGAMKDFERGADHFSYNGVSGVREVRMLSDSFGHMVQQIKQLMENARNEEINLRKTELRALQAQINPHFLYNTLDSISWMCEQGKNAEAVRMVNALATLFRISISRGHELISIRSELQHAESYLKIQSYRYKNQFTYAFDADADCLDYLCNKITLQPIIENAIYHGINGLVDEGSILVTVRSDGEDILFTVEDNGMGMDSEQIEAIMSKDRSDHAGIGIKNVNDRLKIYFGSGYGIHIDSIPDEGTRVCIRMPKVLKEADYENR